MEYRIQGKTLKDIADSIRSVDPNIQALSPQEMDDEIRRLTAVVDQTYDSESSNPISGKAVKQAIEPLSEKVQPDYNQNDPTAKDYIKNRPCYTEEVETTLTLLDGTFDFEEDPETGVYAGVQDNISITFEEGKTYTVVFDGTSYSCTGYIPDEGVPIILGNISILEPSMSGGNNEPFIIIIFNNGTLVIATNLTDASHTVTITTQEITTNIKQLDEKYIPDSVQPDWNQNDSSAKYYIKNRTHYEETINTPVEIYRNISNAGFRWGTSHVGFSGGGNIISTKLLGPRFIEGNRYRFSIRSAGSTPESRPNPIYSQEMDCYKYSDNILCLSSGTSSIDIENSTVSVDSNNGVVIVFYKDTKETIIFANQIGQSSNASIVIDQLSGTYIHQLDEKYLPNEIYTIIDTKMDKINPKGTGSFSLNRKADTTIGVRSFAEGDNTTASGSYSHAEGSDTTASGSRSHAEGESTTASGTDSHAEGYYTKALSDYSHTEGYYTTASGGYSHAEGESTTASGNNSHAEGSSTTASGVGSHAEGSGTTALGTNSYAGGYNTTASGQSSHAEGSSTNKFSSVVTTTNPTDTDIITAWKSNKFSVAKGTSSHVEGQDSLALGDRSHAEGSSTTASGNYSHSEGFSTAASGISSHAEGYSTNNFTSVVTKTNPTNDNIITAWKDKKFSVAKGNYSHAEGRDNLALGDVSHAEGQHTTASGNFSHAEGNQTTAEGQGSHAEGDYTSAVAMNSHAEGSSTRASGTSSHAEGSGTRALGLISHAEGANTKASSSYQHVQGKFNIEDSSNIYADIIGNGTSDTARSNAATVDWSGNAWYAGDVYVGSTSGTNKDEGSKKLATEEYVDSKQSGTAATSLGITGAAVGQIGRITAVDSEGKPTAWGPVDMPSGGGEKVWRKIKTITISEDVTQIDITEDDNGNPFIIKEFSFYAYTLKTGIATQCVIKLINGVVDFASLSVDNILQASYAQMHTRCHVYHDGVGYCVDRANHYSGAFGTFFRDPVIVAEIDKQDITGITFKSAHSNGKFVAGSKIELWGVDA